MKIKSLQDERIEAIISVNEREEEAETKTENKEKKDLKAGKTGNKKDGELVKKEKAEEGALSMDIFKAG